MIQHTIRQATQADLDCLLPLYRAAAARPDCPWDETYPDAATLQADLAEGRLFCAKDPEGRVMGAYALTGRLLADAVARLARRGCRSCRILVAHDNHRALRAYAGQGFARVGSARLYDTDFDCFEKALEGEAI